MSKFNKDGVEFTHKVSVPKDPNTDPTYSHTFPVAVAPGVIEERWSTKVRPIKDLTKCLQGYHLKRNIDYMIDYDGITQEYEYWFLCDDNAFWFKLTAGHMMQSHSAKGKTFRIECPCCNQVFDKKDIIWK
tara:strand:+ start:67 stop:459 length:393 start_codon:yes stop_codon:yes gene_type:complete